MIDKECIHWKVCKPISGYFNVKLECKDCPNRDDEWTTLANQMRDAIRELQAEIERLKGECDEGN